MFGYLFFAVAYFLDLVDEPPIDISGFTYPPYTYTDHQRILYPEYPVPLRRFDIFNQFISIHHALAIVTQTNSFILQTLTCFLNSLCKASANGHYFANRLHL